MTKNVLIASWATISQRHATIGDRLAVAVVREALSGAGVTVADVTRDNWSAQHRDQLSPDAILVWVCGPVDISYDKQREILGPEGAGWIISDATLIRTTPDVALRADISTVRDGPGCPTRADFATLAPPDSAPRVAAVMLRGHQPEYRQDPSIHTAVATAVEIALGATSHYPLPLDTTCPLGLSAGQAAAALELLLAQAAVVITSRLHGIVHAVRAGVLPIVIDEIIGGGKVTACATAFGLPVLPPEVDLVDRLAAAISNYDRRQGSAARLLQEMQSSARQNLDKLVDLVTARGRSVEGPV